MDSSSGDNDTAIPKASTNIFESTKLDISLPSIKTTSSVYPPFMRYLTDNFPQEYKSPKQPKLVSLSSLHKCELISIFSDIFLDNIF